MSRRLRCANIYPFIVIRTASMLKIGGVILAPNYIRGNSTGTGRSRPKIQSNVFECCLQHRANQLQIRPPHEELNEANKRADGVRVLHFSANNLWGYSNMTSGPQGTRGGLLGKAHGDRRFVVKLLFCFARAAIC